jgi:hypothetical protein
MTHSRPAQGATYTAKAAHAHERTVIMSFKVIRATAPELAVQMVGGAHPTRPRMASLWGLRMRSTIGKMSKLQLLLRNTGNELPVPPMVYVHEPTALVVRTLYVSRSCVYLSS